MHNGHFQLWLLRNRGSRNNTEVAKLVGVSRTMFSRWTNGHSRPSLDHFVKICKVLALDKDHEEHMLTMGIKSMVCDIRYTQLKGE